MGSKTNKPVVARLGDRVLLIGRLIASVVGVDTARTTMDLPLKRLLLGDPDADTAESGPLLPMGRLAVWMDTLVSLITGMTAVAAAIAISMCKSPDTELQALADSLIVSSLVLGAGSCRSRGAVKVNVSDSTEKSIESSASSHCDK